MKKEWVVLVNEKGRRIGKEEKMAAHKKGLLHLAFSIFLFDRNGKMLIQKRTKTKYHFAGKWSNACCGHPKPEEEILHAANRRLKEELGVICLLNERGNIRYRFTDEVSGLIENEYDHVLTGLYDGKIHFDRKEIEKVYWINRKGVKGVLRLHRQKLTPWLPEGIKLLRSTGNLGNLF